MFYKIYYKNLNQSGSSSSSIFDVLNFYQSNKFNVNFNDREKFIKEIISENINLTEDVILDKLWDKISNMGKDIEVHDIDLSNDIITIDKNKKKKLENVKFLKIGNINLQVNAINKNNKKKHINNIKKKIANYNNVNNRLLVVYQLLIRSPLSIGPPLSTGPPLSIMSSSVISSPPSSVISGPTSTTTLGNKSISKSSSATLGHKSSSIKYKVKSTNIDLKPIQKVSKKKKYIINSKIENIINEINNYKKIRKPSDKFLKILLENGFLYNQKYNVFLQNKKNILFEYLLEIMNFIEINPKTWILN